MSFSDNPAFSNSTSFKQLELPLFDEGICVSVENFLRSPDKDPYLLGKIKNLNSEKLYSFLIDAEDYSMDHAKKLVNQKVKLFIRENGLKIKPINYQSKAVQDLLINNNSNIVEEKGNEPTHTIENNTYSEAQYFVESIIGAIVRDAKKYGVPTAIAIAVPDKNN